MARYEDFFYSLVGFLMDAWIAIIASLLGVVVGGLLQHFTAKSGFYRQKTWERDRLLQQKLEEIAELAETVGRKMGGLYGQAIAAVESGQPYRPEPDLIPIARLEILIHCYAPELSPHVEGILGVRNELGKPLSEALLQRSLMDKPERQQLNAQLCMGMVQASSLCEAIAKGAAELVRRRLALESHTPKKSNSAAPADGSRSS